MTRGRKPKPTALKKLQGNPGRRPYNAQEPKPDGGDRPPRMPSHLSKTAKKEWRKSARKLWEAGLLTSADILTYELCLEAYATWRDARDLVEKEGYIILGAKGTWIKNPAQIISEKAWDTYLKYAREFGLTPSSRSTIKGGSQEPERLSLSEGLDLELELFERARRLAK